MTYNPIAFNKVESGNLTPSVSGNTDYGIIYKNTVSGYMFHITNAYSGPLDLPLYLTGDPIVKLTGDLEFSVISEPLTTIAPGENTSFIVEFAPIETAEKQTIITIENNSANNPFTFVLAVDGGEDVYEYQEVQSNITNIPIFEYQEVTQ